MSKTIDNKVVEMRFDNSQFEKNVSTSMSTLDKLKKSLRLDGATKGLEEINATAKKVDFSGVGNGIETVKAKISSFQVMAVTALANITNSAVNAGKKFVSAFTIDPIKTGFQEYETQINSVQTILANTESKGSTLQDVNNALNELNKYADMTIYNFTEMTRNIGTFTAAGVDLDTSVSAIKGIANLAAVSGSTSQQASTAMYQLSQALASGTVKLMDWNSVVNAGMGGQVFQDALKETARVHNVNIDAMIKKEGSFRETLQNGWLTSSILTETLEKFTGDLSKEQLKAIGYTDDQIKAIMKMGKTANDAATKVKTFTQLIDTLKEAAQSGWTKSWELIIGDFGEAKEFLTEISDRFSKIIGDSSDARNNLLMGGLSTGWKQLLNEGVNDAAGFEETVTKVAKSHGKDISKMIKDDVTFQDTLKKGWLTSDILQESITKYGKKLRKMSAAELEAAGYTEEQVKAFTKLEKKVKDGKISLEEFSKLISRPSGRENLIEALRNSLDAILSVITPVKEAFREIFPPATGEQLYSLTEKIRDFTAKLKLNEDRALKVKETFKGLFSIFDLLRKGIVTVLTPIGKLLGSDGVKSVGDLLLDAAASIGQFFTALNKGADSGKSLEVISGGISKIVGGISNTLSSATEGIRGFSDIFSKVFGWISKVAGKIKDVIVNAFGWITDNVSIGDVFAGLAGGGIFVAFKKVGDFISKIGDLIDKITGNGTDDKKGLADSFSEILDKVHDSLEAFTTGIKSGSFLTIAIAIGVLSASLSSLAELKAEDISKGLLAIGSMMAMLNGSFKSISKSTSVFGAKGVIKAGISLIAMSISIKILSDAMVTISSLNSEDIAKGLIAIGGGLLELTGALKLVGTNAPSLKTSIAIVVLAKSCEILGDALKKFSGMSWDEIGRGLSGMGGALGELTAVLSILGKFGGSGSLYGAVGVYIISKSLDEISENLERIGSLSWSEIGRGLTGMGVALAELGAVVGLLGKFTGFSGIFGGLSILIAVQALEPIADALSNIGMLSWSEIGKGLTGIGVALVELGAVVGLLGKFTGFSSIFGSLSILIAVQALKPIAEALSDIGSLSWSEIGRGLTGMGVALLEIGGISGALGYLAGFSGILGGAAIWVAVQGLDDLAEALKKFGSMSWDEIGRGLTGMGVALLEVGGISGALGAFTGLAGVFGGAAIWVAVQGLDDLAEALKKFGSMSWDEIGRGLTGMGVALGEVALGSLLNTLSGLGAISISKVAEPLGQLADSVKKWAGVSVPEDLSSQLGALSRGIFKMTFSDIGAGALAKVAVPLGQLADSVKKWSGVTVPEGIGDGMKKIAHGVEAFTFALAGGWSISAVAEPLGTLAGSVKKWSNVTIPEGIDTGLSSIASGVESFTFAFAGGWSIGAIVEPLANLADSVSKWNKVTIPEGIGTGLSSIANGIESFTFAFVGGWVLGDIVEPLGTLADSVKKWSGVKIGTNIGEELSSLSEGLKSFTGAFVGGWTVSKISGPLGELGTAVQKFSNINVENINASVEGVKQIGNAVKGLSDIDFSGASSKLSSFAESINKVKVSNKSFTNLGKNLVDSFVKSVDSGKDRARTSAKNIAKTAADNLKANGKASNAGQELISNFIKGIRKKESNTKTTAKTIAENAASSIKGVRSSFVTAGNNLGEGLIVGINAKWDAVYNAGYALGQAAVKGEKDGQASNSPSKLTIKAGKWLGQGLVIGMEKMNKVVYKAGYGLGDTATSTISSAISRISDYVNSDIDAQPTIRPVLDLSDVANGANSINRLFNANPSVGVLSNINSISSMMNKRRNGNSDVVDAVNSLNDTMTNIKPGNSYNINGITYDDGSNVAKAIETLIRATKIERRV